MIKNTQVAVIGSGVIGLHTALEATNRGSQVTIYHTGDLWSTCSAKSAASFKPHEVVYDETVHFMVKHGWDVFDFLSKDTDAGVRLHTHWEASSARKDPPRYLEVMQGFKEFVFPNVPGGYAYGWRYETFFIDMSVHLPWLEKLLRKSGVNFVPVSASRFNRLDDLTFLEEEIIFNCTGLGAGKLCDDPSVYPIKGQVVLIGPIADMDWSISADGFYIYPRKNDTVLGGTTEHHIDSDTNDAAVTQVLLRANKRIRQTLSLGDVLELRCGLRPYREFGVRLEKETRNSKTIIHNYGHGGSGVTLAPGSSKMAVDLI